MNVSMRNLCEKHQMLRQLPQAQGLLKKRIREADRVGADPAIRKALNNKRRNIQSVLSAHTHTCVGCFYEERTDWTKQAMDQVKNLDKSRPSSAGERPTKPRKAVGSIPAGGTNFRDRYCARHMWNTLMQGPCCQCMTPDERIAYVWNQMRLMWAKAEHVPLMCPYCLTVNAVDAELCCKTLKRAVAAITERENAVDKLMEKASRN